MEKVERIQEEKLKKMKNFKNCKNCKTKKIEFFWKIKNLRNQISGKMGNFY